MVKVSFNKLKNKVIIRVFGIKSSIFQELSSILQKYTYSWSKKEQAYRGSPLTYIDLKIELLDIIPLDEFNVHPYTEKLIADACIVNLDIKKYRGIYEPTLLKYPALKGKHPYEDYQIEDIKKIISHNRFGCFWIMGAGKAWCISYILTNLFKYNKVDKAVMIAPPDGLINIKLEVMKFSSLFKEEDFFIANRFNKDIFKTNDYKILLCTYTTWIVLNNYFYKQQMMKKRKRVNGKLVSWTDADFKENKVKTIGTKVINFSKYWGNNNDKLIILDESQMISNYKSKTSKYLHLYKNLFEYRYLFSGTPADTIEKYYSQITFLDQNLIPKKYNDWLMEIAYLGNSYDSMAINKYKDDKVDQFLKSIIPYVVRRGREVLDLPEHIMEKNYVEMNDLQLQIYQYLIDFKLFEIDQQHHAIKTKEIYNSFPYVIQALDNPCLLQDNKLDDKFGYNNIAILNDLLSKWKFEDHPKLELTDYLIDQYICKENRKMILWSYHPKTIDQLAKYYHKYDPLIIHGQIPNISEKDRINYVDDIVYQFKTKDVCPLLIASSIVLQRAKTITEATRQIYFDRNFSYIVFNQSSSRIYRPGTKEMVKTNILITSKSLDLHVDNIIEQRSDIDHILLNKEYLTKEEIKDIFMGIDIK